MSSEVKGTQEAKRRDKRSEEKSLLWPAVQVVMLVAACAMIVGYSLDIRTQVHNIQSMQVATVTAFENANKERERYLYLIEALETNQQMSFITYTVGLGENLTLIASRFVDHGVTVEGLKADNKLNTDYIQVGQKLIVRLR